MILQPSTPIVSPAAIARLTDSAPPATICAWCPDFNPQAASNVGASHTICPSCRERFEQEVA